jgi:hypothetical protein
MSDLNLGTTWEEAVDSAYKFGYREYNREDRYPGLKEQMQVWEEEVGQSDAISIAMNDVGIDATIHGNAIHEELWQAIDAFFEEEMPDELNERFQREATVASEIDVAFEAGVYDALFENEEDTSEVEHLYKYDPQE